MVSQRSGKRPVQEALASSSGLAVVPPEVSGSSMSSPGGSVPSRDVHEKAMMLARTPDGPESKRKKRSSAVAIQSISVADQANSLEFQSKSLALKVLLPNRRCVRMGLDKEHPISLLQFLGRLEQQAREKGPQYSENIDWEGKLWLQDPIDKDVPLIQTDKDLQSFIQCLQGNRTVLLVDGSPDALYGDEEMWNVTPTKEIISRQKLGYTLATALADQVDNALQAVWDVVGLRHISVDIEPDKITIFDNGKGMSADDGPDSIAMRFTFGSSSHRNVHYQAMGSSQLPPPILLPYLGMYGAGGPASALSIGSAVTVYSKKKSEPMVGSLIANPDTLSQQWMVPGDLRPMSKIEKEKATHGSFTKVEITQLRKQYDITKTGRGGRTQDDIMFRELSLKQMLKDIYAPYIQSDVGKSFRTIFPVSFEVNGQNLTEVEGGEVTVSNKNSCTAEDFSVDLHFRMDPDAYSEQTGVKAKDEAHARLCCQYFPNIKGKEALESVLDELDCIKPGETFHTMRRVTVRWLGRLLPETKWPLLPFMEVCPRPGKDGVHRQWAKRVKACLYTDAGFFPTQTKTALDKDHPFTVAARNLGANDQGMLKTSISGIGVKVCISRNGKSITPDKLVKEYRAWLKAMHESFDEEITFPKNDTPTYVFKHKGLEDWCTQTNCSPGGFLFHTHIEDGKNSWDTTKAPLRIKLQKGLRGLNRDLFATVEFFFHSLQDGENGEVWMVCRPLDVMDTNGSQIIPEGSIMLFQLGKSKLFPIFALTSEKSVCVTEQQWQRKEQENQSKAPSHIALLGYEESQSWGINDFVAVVRTKHGSGSSKQASICAEPMELNMRAEFSGPRESERKQLFQLTCKATAVAGVKGVYKFNLQEANFGGTLDREGNFFFTFSLVSEKFKEVRDQEYVLRVKPAEQTAEWKILQHSRDSTTTKFRLDETGSRSFLLQKLDKYGNYQVFKNQEEVNDLQLGMQVLAPGGNDLGITAVWKMVSLTTDKKGVIIQDLHFSAGNLSPVQPRYKAVLRFQLPDSKFQDVDIQVLPGLLASVELKHSQDFTNVSFKPGDVIRELMFQGFDGAGNKVDSSQRVVVKLESLVFLRIQKDVVQLQDDGSLDLGGNLKVTGTYGSSGEVMILSEERSQLLEVPFKVVFRTLRLREQIPDMCFLGQSLCDLVVDVIDEAGTIDKSMDGGSHNLQGNWNHCTLFPLRSGSCNLPPVVLPSVIGPWCAEISHTQYPSVKIVVKVKIEMDLAVRLAAKPGQNDIIWTGCGESCSAAFVPVAESGQPGRLQQEMIEGLTIEAKLVSLNDSKRSRFPLDCWTVEDLDIKSLFEEGLIGYASNFKLTGPAGIYTVTLRGDWGHVAGENLVSWSVGLRHGKPDKLSVFLSKPGYEAHHGGYQQLKTVKVPRYGILPSFDVHLVDASGNLCETNEEFLLQMDTQGSPGWAVHSESVKQGRAHFESFRVDVDIGTYVIYVRPSDTSVCQAAASFTVHVTAGNYPAFLRLIDPSPIVVSLDGEDVQHLPSMAVAVEAADGQSLKERICLCVAVCSKEGIVRGENPQHFGELAEPVQSDGKTSTVITFGRVPTPFQSGEYQLRFSLASEHMPSLEPVFLPLTVHHGPPTGMEAGHNQHKLIITVVDKHGNRCNRLFGLDITARSVGTLQEFISTVERGQATFDDLPFQVIEPKLQLRIFMHKQKEFQFSLPDILVTVKVQRMQQQRREAQHRIDAFTEELRLIEEDIAKIEGQLKAVEDSHERIGAHHQSDVELLEREKEKAVRTEVEIYRDLHQHKGRSGYAAALALLAGRQPNGFLSLQSGDPAAADVLGLVATLGRVESAALNSVLSDYLGSSMALLVCKTYRGSLALESYSTTGEVDQTGGLGAFARSRNYEIKGRYSITILEYLRTFKRPDNQDPVIRGHPQQLLNMDPPRLPQSRGCPRGFLAHAVNLIHLRDEHLQIRIQIRGQNVGLRESLLFDVYKYLPVFDTRENVEAFRAITHQAGWDFKGAVSLDGGIWRGNARRDLGQSSRNSGLLYATVPYEERVAASLLPPARDAFDRMKTREALKAEYNQDKKAHEEKVVSRREPQRLLVKFQQTLALAAEEEAKERSLVAQWQGEMESINQ